MKYVVGESSESQEPTVDLTRIPILDEVFNRLDWKDVEKFGATSKGFQDIVREYGDNPGEKKRKSEEKSVYHQLNAFEMYLDRMDDDELADTYRSCPRYREAIDAYKQKKGRN